MFTTDCQNKEGVSLESHDDAEAHAEDVGNGGKDYANRYMCLLVKND